MKPGDFLFFKSKENGENADYLLEVTEVSFDGNGIAYWVHMGWIPGCPPHCGNYSGSGALSSYANRYYIEHLPI